MIESGVGAAIVMLKLLVVVAAGVAESVTRTVKVDVPEVVGVPEMPPVEAFRVSPAGREKPLTSDHVYGLVPPLAARVPV